MFYKGLYGLLVADAGLAAILGPRSDGTTGIFSVVAPKEVTIPYLVYQQIGAEPVISYAGTNRLQFADFRFFSNAADYPTAKKLARALKNALDGFRGTLDDGTGSPVTGATNLESTISAGEHDNVVQDLQMTIFTTIVDYHFVFADNS